MKDKIGFIQAQSTLSTIVDFSTARLGRLDLSNRKVQSNSNLLF
jgi:hypothetical protein